MRTFEICALEFESLEAREIGDLPDSYWFISFRGLVVNKEN